MIGTKENQAQPITSVNRQLRQQWFSVCSFRLDIRQLAEAIRLCG